MVIVVVLAGLIPSIDLGARKVITLSGTDKIREFKMRERRSHIINKTHKNTPLGQDIDP